MRHMRLRTSSRKAFLKRGQSRCKRGIVRSGAKFGSRTQGRRFRKKYARIYSILSLRPKKLVKEQGRAWPLLVRWLSISMAEPFTSKPRRGPERLSLFVSRGMRRHLLPRRGRHETHLVRGRRKQDSGRHSPHAAYREDTLGYAVCGGRRSGLEGLRGGGLRRGHLRHADARNGWSDITRPYSGPLSEHSANYPFW